MDKEHWRGENFERKILTQGIFHETPTLKSNREITLTPCLMTYNLV